MSDLKMPDDVRAALEAYRGHRDAAHWTTLSQLFVGDVDVLDALQALKPDFPDPLPLPIDGLPEDSDDFFQWPELPDPDDVSSAILHALRA